jgi:hypothetical protein
MASCDMLGTRRNTAARLTAKDEDPGCGADRKGALELELGFMLQGYWPISGVHAR